jgi:hypothetical protein
MTSAYQPPEWESTDSMLMTDEWEHIQYLISEYLKACDIEGCLEPCCLPFMLLFEGVIKDKLINAGFEKKDIEDIKHFEKLIMILDEQGLRYSHWQWDKNPPFGLPAGSFTISKDNHTMWVKRDIEAALRTLESISIVKGLLMDDRKINTYAVKVYLRTLELTINLMRAGIVPRLAATGVKTVSGGEKGGKKSGKTRQDKATRNSEIYQKEADKVWKKHSTWGALEVSKKVSEKIGQPAETIRRKIKKSLP